MSDQNNQNEQFLYMPPGFQMPNALPPFNQYLPPWNPTTADLSAFNMAYGQTPNFGFGMNISNQSLINDSGLGLSMHSAFETPKNISEVINHTSTTNDTEESTEDSSSMSRMSNYDDENCFQIPGRLGLLNSNRTYVIGMDEIKRRLGSPEKLNASYLNGIVRKAKGRAAGQKLRAKLDKNRLNVEHGRRINVKTTGFLPLCEEEAIRVAEDFESLLGKFMPRQLLKQALRSSVKANIKELRSNIRDLRHSLYQNKDSTQMLIHLSQFLPKELARIFENDQTLKIQKEQQMDQCLRRNPEINFPDELQRKLWDLNLATHNFAGLGLKAIFKKTTLSEDQMNAGTSQQTAAQLTRF